MVVIFEDRDFVGQLGTRLAFILFVGEYLSFFAFTIKF